MVQNCSPGHFGHTRTRTAPQTDYSALFCSPCASALGLPPFGLSPPLAASSALRLFLPFGTSSSSLAGAKIFTEPPAFSTAAIADLEARQTENSILLLSSPSPRSLTPPFSRRISPALTMAAASTGALRLNQPGVDPRLTLPDIDPLNLPGNGGLAKPPFGQATMQGLRPPLKPFKANPGARVLPFPAATASLAHA